jgi:hypothetical protein
MRRIYSDSDSGETIIKETDNINPYLASGPNIFVTASPKPLSNSNEMSFGNMANDGGFLLLDSEEALRAVATHLVDSKFIRPILGSQEFIRGQERRCIWVSESDSGEAKNNKWLNARFETVKSIRSSSTRQTTRELADVPHRFGEVRQNGTEKIIIVPRVSSETREYLPVGYLNSGSIISDSAFALYNAPIWNMSLIASRLHLVWIATVCGKLKTDFRYSNTLGWNTFPIPVLTEQNKADLTTCAEAILLAREAHFPASLADLYEPEKMPENLRLAHERNDEVIERIYIGRRFKNDTERLEKLFELYTKMTVITSSKKGKK